MTVVTVGTGPHEMPGAANAIHNVMDRDRPQVMHLNNLAGIPLAIAQLWLNAYWRSVEPPAMTIRHAFTVKELLAIIVGASLLGLVATGYSLHLDK